MTSSIKSKWLLLPFWALMSLTAFAQKKVISITSTIEIKATQSDIFNTLKNLARYPEWSPFLVTDPQQQHHVTGRNGEINSTFHWEGVGEKSKGHQTLSAMTSDEFLRFNCTIEKPFKGNPTFDYRFEKSNGHTLVIQQFDLPLSNFAYFMTKMFGVKKKMEAANKLGMERLKTLLEKESSLTIK